MRGADFGDRPAVRVKICGVTNITDALAAVDAGADALGFMFVPASPRALKLETAASIIRELPPFVSRVGVMVLLGPSLISEGQGDQSFGISGGAALLVRLARHVGIRLDVTPRIYFSGADGSHPGIVVALSLTSLPGGK